MTAGGSHGVEQLAPLVEDLVRAFPVKFYWFLKHGYRPHVWQILFHAANDGSQLTRFRHLVAGRRGGKTLSAAWEVLFYALHPREFHRDAHGEESERALWIWALAKDYKLGRPSLLTFLEVLRQAGLIKDKDYRFNKTERYIEFIESGSIIEFKTADDPQSLRGAGLDILWIDESAFIPTADAWHVVRPALADKLGLVVTTTTPWGKNWFWEEFWGEKAQGDSQQFRVEYTSIDNPYFPRSEWDYALEHFHPVVFKQEFMAAFDAMQGIALQGDWLHYYVHGLPDTQAGDISLKEYRNEDGVFQLRLYIGIDPAISLADAADHFCMALIGITEDNSQGFLLDTYKGKIAFPDQLDKIREWHLKYRPMYIGIESNAFQVALAQQSARMEGLPPVVPVISKGKKNDRILSMSPLFKIGKIRIHRLQADFIDQWVSFDPEKKNQDDDLLDAVEIALGVAGVLLPQMPAASHFENRPPQTVEEEALASIRASRENAKAYDDELGSEA